MKCIYLLNEKQVRRCSSSYYTAAKYDPLEGRSERIPPRKANPEKFESEDAARSSTRSEMSEREKILRKLITGEWQGANSFGCWQNWRILRWRKSGERWTFTVRTLWIDRINPFISFISSRTSVLNSRCNYHAELFACNNEFNHFFYYLHFTIGETILFRGRNGFRLCREEKTRW